MPERAWLPAVALAFTTCAAPAGPAAPGGGPVARAAPAFVSGDECLFCHREKVGAGWEREAHNRTIRHALGDEPALRALRAETPEADRVGFLLGAGDRVRFLKEAGFGRFSLLSKEGPPAWDDHRFGTSCAGCHTTAVSPETGRFEAPSLDCFVCHGSPPREHTERPEAAFLSPRRSDPARTAVSVCASCHLRGGRSRSSGRPWPDRFVPGDDLFRDYEIDLSDAALARASTADRHVLENVRDVLRGDGRTTCLSCHSVHRPSHARHRRLPEAESCFTCHVRGAPLSERRPFTRGSPVCEQ